MDKFSLKKRVVRFSKPLTSLLLILLATMVFSPQNTYAQHKGISFQAVLKKPDGTYPNISGLSVTLQVLDPISDCVLREEVHSGVNISNGYINLTLGSPLAATPGGRNPAPLLSINQVMDNSTTRFGLNCVDANNNITSSNQTYIPNDTHARKLRLRAVIGGDTVVADFNMRAIAYAVNAENLGGKAASSFVQTSAAITQANVESVFSRYTVLDSLLNGTYAGNAATATALASAPGACPAGQYMTAMTASGAITCGTPTGSVTSVTSANSYLSVATGTTTPVLTVNVGTAAGTVAAGDDARFTDARVPSGAAGGDLSGTYPNPSVAKIAGKSVVLTTPANGEVLQYDGTKFVNAAISTADATKLPLAGGTMSGAIDMGSQNLTNVGYITMSASKSLHLSNNAADPAGLTAADKGKVWYNSTTGEVKYWNGSAAVALGAAGSGLQNFNGQTGTSQTLAIGTSGTAPAWSSVTDTHTLNIPLASTAAVTAGLISKTDYDTFSSKLGTSSSFAGDVTGTSGTMSVDKIKGKIISPGAYASGQVLRYDGTNWVNAVLGFSDLGSKPTTLAGYGITDAQSSTLTDGKILVGNGSNVATAVTMSGDATLSNTGALTLNTVPMSKGGTGVTSFAGDKVITTSAAGALQASSCTLNQVISFTAGGAITCADPVALGSPNTTKGDITVHNGTSNVRLPVGTNNYVLQADSTQAAGVKWAALPSAPGDATYAAKGLIQFNTDASTSGVSVTSGVATINAGTAANQIVKLDGTAKLPAVDGSALTNVTASAYTGTLPIANGGTNSNTALNNNRMIVSSGGKIVEAAAMTDGQVVIGSTGAAPVVGSITGSNGVSVTPGAGTLALSTNATSANTASTIVARDASGNFSAGAVTTSSLSTGAITSTSLTTGAITATAVTNTSNVLKGATSGNLTMTVPATVTSYTLTWPAAVGGAGSFLTTDASGNLSWGSPAAISDASYSTKGAVQFLTDAATSGLTVSSGVVNVNSGTSANQIVKLDGTSKLPAVDGSALTNLSAGNIATGTLPIARGGTNSGTALTNGKVMVSSAGAIVEGNASNTAKSNNTFVMRDGSGNIAGALGTFDQLAVNGSVSGTVNVYAPSTFTSWNLTLPTTAGTNGYVLTTNGSGVTSWTAASSGTVTNVTAGTGLNVGAGPGGSITSAGTLNIDVGTGANQIVQLTAASKLPAVDGSLLTNLNPAALSSALPIANGGTGQTTKTAAFDALSPATTKGDLAVFNGTNNVRLPAGTNNYVLQADSTQATGLKWAALPSAPGDASYAAKGLVQFDTDAATSGVSVTAGVASINAGTSANQLVKLDGTAKLPAVDGSALTNLSAGNIATGTLPIARGGTNSGTALSNDRLMVSSSGKIIEAAAMTNGQMIIGSTGAAPVVGTISGSNGVSVTTGAGTLALSTNATSANTASTIVSRDASGNFTAGAITATSVTAGAVTNTSNILKGATSGTLTMQVPATVTSYSLTWPAAVGGAGSFLTTDASGNLSWGSPAAISDSSYSAKGAVQFLTDAATSGITISSGVANVNTGTSANQIVKLDGTSKLPAVDGSALTNLNAGNIATGTLPIARGGTNSGTALTNGKVMISSAGAIVEGNASNTAKSNNTFVMRDGSGNIAGALGTFDQLSLNGSVSGAIQVAAPSTTANYTFTLPNSAGTNGYVLSTNGSGVTSWVAAGGAGTVTNITAGTGLNVGAGPGGSITSTGTLNIDVGTGANQIVQLTAASKYPAVDGSLITSLNPANLSVAVPITKGGTGQTTQTAGFDALAPNTTKGDLTVHNGTNNVRLPAGANNYVLQADSAQATGLKWAALPSAPVDASYAAKGLVQFDTDAATSGVSVTAGVVSVNTGTSANQIVKLDGTSKLPAVDGSALTNLNAGNIATGTLPIARGGTNSGTALTNGKVMVSSAGAIVEGVASNTAKSNNTFVMRDGSGNIAGALGTFDQLALNGSVSGTIQVAVPSTTANYTFTLPNSAGTSGYVLQTNGSGVTSWVAAGGSGTVTNITAGTGLNVGAGPNGSITSTGTLNIDVGTTASKIVQLTAAAKYPAVDGSLITNLAAGNLTGTVAVANGGTGQTTKTAAFDALSPNTTKGDLEVHNGTNNVRLPAGTNNFVLTADSTAASGVKWAAVPGGSDASYSTKGILQILTDAATSGLTIASGVLNVNFGTGANQIVKLDGTAKLPAVDGSALTNLNAGNIASGTLPITRGGTGTTSFTGNGLPVVNGGATGFNTLNCLVGQYLSFDATGIPICSTVPGGFVNNGNSYGGVATLGTNDAFALRFETNGVDRIAIKSNGYVGIGNTNPAALLDITAATNIANDSLIAATYPGSATAHYPSVSLMNFMSTAAPSGNPELELINSRGTSASPSPLTSGDMIASINFSGEVDTATNWKAGATIQAYADGNFSATNSPAYLIFNTVPAASTTQTERMRITSDGKVGIGTTAPSAPFNVVSSTDVVMETQNTTSSGKNVFIMKNSGSKSLRFFMQGPTQSYNPDSAIVASNAATKLMLLTSEDVSTGGTAPLQVITGGWNNTPSLTVTAGSPGNVGIGTTSPASNLSVVSQSSAPTYTGIMSEQYSTDNWGAQFTGRKARGTLASPTAVANGDWLMAMHPKAWDGSAWTEGGYMAFVSNGTVSAGSVPTDFFITTGSSGMGTERFRITSAGNVGIGTSSPSTDKLHVVGDIRVGTSGTNGCVKSFGGSGLTGSCSSDLRLKKDLRPLGEVSDSLVQIHPTYFHWRTDEFPKRGYGEQEELGVIAQDVAKAIPELTEIDDEGFFKVRYHLFTMYLLKGFSENYEKIKAIFSELDSHSREIAAIKAESAAKDQKIKDLEARLQKIEDALNNK